MYGWAYVHPKAVHLFERAKLGTAVDTFTCDVVIVGAGGAGLRAAIAIAESHPALSVALVSKVYPMRSHTVAAEGGAAAVTQAHDSLDHHFNDTVSGGDWLCDQDVVQTFVAHCHEELVQMEHWGCPWSRTADGHANVRAFGGMKIERTWFAADKTGFHMLHTLFQTSIKHPSIKRFDEHFVVDLLVHDGRRYLQDYGLGPASDKPRNKAMELGPRDRLSQAYWHEKQNGRTVRSRHGECVHLDLRHLGERLLRERLPQIYELAEQFLGVDPAKECIPVLPAVHYTMGGILADGRTASTLPGLYSAGECSSVGIHGANRLGSNSLTELLVFGKLAGLEAAAFAQQAAPGEQGALLAQAQGARTRALDVLTRSAESASGGERLAELRREMAQSMEDGCGIYRTGTQMRATCRTIDELKQRFKRLRIDDHSKGWNTEWLLAIELGYLLDVAQAMVYSALSREESRGSHQRLDGFEQRDDLNFLKHTLAHFTGDEPPRISHGAVTITRSPPGTRAYGALGEQADAARHAGSQP